MTQWKIRLKLSRSMTLPSAALCRSIGRTLAATALDVVMLALAGWGKEGAQIAMSNAAIRSRCVLLDTLRSVSGGLRDVMASVHSCSFHLGQAAGTIAHGFARLHPDKLPGLAVSAAILVAIAYALACVRCGGGWHRDPTRNHDDSK